MGLLSPGATALAAAAVLAAPAWPGGGAGWDDFPAFVWRQDHRGRPLPVALAEPFGGTNVERDDALTWPPERPLAFYVGHAPGRDELHLRREGVYLERFEAWYVTRDPRLLVREPCLTDPETRARLFATLERSLAARGGDAGLGVSLGDEVSLTPWGDPLDLCRSATCEAAWRAYAALTPERDLPERAPTTDEVRVRFGNGDTEGLGAWLARRRFHQEVVLSLLEDLAARARELAPGTPVGLLGLGGRTAFGGVAVERAAAFLDFLECYPTEDARELFATVRRPGQRSLATIFPERTPDTAAARLWEHLLRGGDGVVLWSDRTLAADPALRERLARAVADVRRVCAAVGPFRPHVGGVALVHSPDSAAVAWLRDALLDGPTWPNRFAGYQREHGTRERALGSWLRLLEDVGVLPGSLPVGSIGAATVGRFPLLVLSHVAVLSDDELLGLEAYAAAGGRFVVQGPFAELDERGERRSAAELEALLERTSRARVATPRHVEDYISPSPGLSPSRRAALRAEVAAWEEVRAHRAPFRVRGEGADAWLLAFERRAGGIVCMALPTRSGPRPRLAVPELAIPGLAIEAPEDHALEWVHPASGPEELRRGDALVFRLRPR